MQILAGPCQSELVVQRSRFLGLLRPVKNPEEARSLLKQTKAEFVDATHVVHAFRTGVVGSETLGSSDDGEPSGTAGRPVLDVLRGEGGGEAILLVVRWYGGINLGTGGLVRAYGDTAKAVIAAAQWEERREWILASVLASWNEYPVLKNHLGQEGAVIDREEFGEGVRLTAKLPKERFAAIQEWTINLARGRSQWSPIED